jgi:hypothetical protein
MPVYFFRRLMDEAKEYALPALTFGLGGEPLLAQDIPRRIQEAIKAGVMDIRLGSNGLLLTENLMDSLIDSGLTRLEISLDAVEPQAYRAIRGGDLKSLEKRIHRFLDKRARQGTPWPLLRVSFLKLEANKNQLKAFLNRWRGVADLIAIQKPIWFPGSQLPAPKPKKIKDIPCGQPWQRLGVTYDGGFWPCCSWYGETLLPRTPPKSLAALWNSKPLRDLRKSLTLGPPTTQCLNCAAAGAF